jgi:hypothetical protein
MGMNVENMKLIEHHSQIIVTDYLLLLNFW